MIRREQGRSIGDRTALFVCGETVGAEEKGFLRMEAAR